MRIFTEKVITMALSLIVVASLLAGGSTSVGAAANGPTEVDSCTRITEPGVYVVTSDVENSPTTQLSETCILIQSDDVVLRGNGHWIDGRGVSDTTGVGASSKTPLTNVTVRNLSVTDWNHGVRFHHVSGGSIENVTARNDAVGISVYRSNDVTVANNTVANDLIGISIHRTAGDSVVSNNTIYSNGIAGLYGEVPVVTVFDRAIAIGPPLDLDGDGRYEDVTGNRDRGVTDVTALTLLATADQVGAVTLSPDRVQTLDFDGDGRFGWGDVLAYVRSSS